MKKKFGLFMMILFLFNVFTITAYANSSWQWVSSSRPLDLLPIVIIVTLLIEILAVNNISKVKDLKKVILIVTLANLVSFLVPYIWLGLDPMNVYSSFTAEENMFYAINYTVEHTPYFTVSVIYLVITLLIETPIVYLFFREKVEKKKTLFYTILIANILTTVITCAVERIFCFGVW